MDNSVPLMPQHFAFEGTDWGHHAEYEELAEDQEYFDQEGLDQLMCEGSSTEPNPYPLDDMLIDPQGEHSEYEVVFRDHKNSTEDINDSYYVENYEDNLE